MADDKEDCKDYAKLCVANNEPLIKFPEGFNSDTVLIFDDFDPVFLKDCLGDVEDMPEALDDLSTFEARRAARAAAWQKHEDAAQEEETWHRMRMREITAVYEAEMARIETASLTSKPSNV